jgi:hypothetical protein
MSNSASTQSGRHGDPLRPRPSRAVPRPRAAATRDRNRAIDWFLTAAVLFGLFAAYLYRPHFADFKPWQWLLPVNACLAAAGAYLLSRRWVAGFTGSFLAGTVYGFGPYLLGLGKFHPTAGLLAAAVPWLFLPAALLRRKGGKCTATALLALPFVAILLFFCLFTYVLAGHRLLAAPLQTGVRPSSLASLIAPLVFAKRDATLIGLWHIPLAALVLGVVMMWKARRYSILAVLSIGLLLAFSRSFLGAGKIAWLSVSPLLWLSIPMTWCAVLSGLGLQGLLEAGFSDRKWILTAAVVLGVLAIVALLLATKYFQFIFSLADRYARLFVAGARMYLLGAVATAIVFFMARQKLRAPWLRWAILCIALSVDIILSARYVVDSIL